MSSGFVSASGASDEPVQRDSAREGAWQKVQQDLEAKRQQKVEQGKQEGGKSLYDVLQANKAAKQDAFEESIRLRNQFRSLDDDEVEFLDSVMESTRAQEAAIKKETSEQLQAFRKQQEEAERAALQENEQSATDSHAKPDAPAQIQWTTKKRRRDTSKSQNAGLKLRKTSSSANEGTDPELQNPASTDKSKVSNSGTTPAKTPASVTAGDEPKSSAPVAAALGLGDYDSDDD